MKKLLSILLLFMSIGTMAQTYDQLPSGSKPYGNQLYLSPTGLIIGGTSATKFRVIGTKKYVDSLLALKAHISPSGEYIQASPSAAQDADIFIGKNDKMKYTSKGLDYQNNPGTGIIFGNNSLDIKQSNINFYTGAIKFISTPATSYSSFDFLTRDIDNGEVKKLPFDAIKSISAPRQQYVVYADEYSDEWLGINTTTKLNEGSAIVKAIRTANSLGGAKIILSAKTYLPTGYDYNTPMKFDNIYLHGESVGYYSFDCKSIIGGTVIQGGFTAWANNFKISDISFDAGKNVCDTYFSGAAREPFTFTNPPGSGGVTKYGFEATGVIRVLSAAPTTLAHSFLVENAEGAKIDHITTCYGIYGFVVKSNNVTIGDVYVYGTERAGFIFKSDGIDNLAAAKNLNIRSLTYDTTPPNTNPYILGASTQIGLHLDGYGASLTNVNISNININGTTRSISITARSGGSLSNVSLGSVILKKSQIGVEINSLKSKDIHFENLKCYDVNVPYQDISESPGSGNYIGELTADNEGYDKGSVGIRLFGSNEVYINKYLIKNFGYAFDLANDTKTYINRFESTVDQIKQGTGTLKYNYVSPTFQEVTASGNSTTLPVYFGDNLVFNGPDNIGLTFINSGSTSAMASAQNGLDFYTGINQYLKRFRIESNGDATFYRNLNVANPYGITSASLISGNVRVTGGLTVENPTSASGNNWELLARNTGSGEVGKLSGNAFDFLNNGTLKLNRKSVISDYTVTENDYTIFVQGNSSNINITLPNASLGRIFIIKRVNGGSGTVTITSAGSIDNTPSPSSIVLTADQSGYTFQSVGSSQYYIIGKF